MACLLILFFLNIGNAAAVYLLFVQKKDFGMGIVPLFLFDRESNFPTLFNGLLLGFGSVVSFSISSWLSNNDGPANDRRGWFGIGAVMAFMMLDELCKIHEALDWILMGQIETEGVVAWPWVIPYALLALGVAGYFLKFYLRLERRYQLILGISAAVYVSGAIGLEMLEAAHTDEHGEDSLPYAVLFSIEETLEMLAVILANWGIMSYAVEKCSGLDLRVNVR